MGEVALTTENLPSTAAELTDEQKETLKRFTGQTTNDGPSNSLPRLSINYDAEYVDDTDEKAEPVTLKRGVYKLSVPVETDGKVTYVTAFCKEPVFRPFIQTFRYSVYDADKGGSSLMSTQFKNWGDAVVDDRGGEFTAKQYKNKAMKRYTDVADGIKCNRTLYGTVSMPDAKDMYGKPIEVADVPCMWFTKGASFMPIADAMDKLDNEGKLLGYYNMKLNSDREKNGGTTYFIANVEWLAEELSVDANVIELFKTFDTNIQQENNAVIEAYKKILVAGKDDDVIDVLADGSLEDDFVDDVIDL